MIAKSVIAVSLVLTALGLQRESQQATTFTSRVEGIQVDALVIDGRRPIAGLAASDFEIRDDGIVQKATLISTEATPVDVRVVLDESNSLSPLAFQQLKEIGSRVGDVLRPIDRVGLTTFTHLVNRRQDLTHDAGSFRSVLELEAPSRIGGTALFDAVFSAIALADPGLRRTLVIVLTDGEDTASWLKPGAVLAAAKKSDVVSYSILTQHETPAVPDGRPGADFLVQLSDVTGGRVLTGTASTIAGRFTEIVAEFQNRYLLSFVPIGPPKPGWHVLDVRVARGKVTARRGYTSGAR